jgi:hypothetical protein
MPQCTLEQTVLKSTSLIAMSKEEPFLAQEDVGGRQQISE